MTELNDSGKGALKTNVWLNLTWISSALTEGRDPVDVVVGVMEVIEWELVLADDRSKGRLIS